MAELLLRALEISLTRMGGYNRSDKRANMDPLTEAFARLQSLRQGAAD